MSSAGCSVLLALVAGACSFETDFPVLATVWQARGGVVLPSDPGSMLAAGQTLRTDAEPGEETKMISLVPGTLAELGPAGEVVLGPLVMTKHAAQLLRRRASLTLRAGTLDVLVIAPERAAESELRVTTPAGEVMVRAGGLLRIIVEPNAKGQAQVPGRVAVFCARGSARWDGGEVPAGAVRRVLGAENGAGSAPSLERIAASGAAQAELAGLLENGARLQELNVQRQSIPPQWRVQGAKGTK